MHESSKISNAENINPIQINNNTNNDEISVNNKSLNTNKTPMQNEEGDDKKLREFIHKLKAHNNDFILTLENALKIESKIRPLKEYTKFLMSIFHYHEKHGEILTNITQLALKIKNDHNPPTNDKLIDITNLTPKSDEINSKYISSHEKSLSFTQEKDMNKKDKKDSSRLFNFTRKRCFRSNSDPFIPKNSPIYNSCFNKFSTPNIIKNTKDDDDSFINNVLKLDLNKLSLDDEIQNLFLNEKMSENSSAHFPTSIHYNTNNRPYRVIQCKYEYTANGCPKGDFCTYKHTRKSIESELNLRTPFSTNLAPQSFDFIKPNSLNQTENGSVLSNYNHLSETVSISASICKHWNKITGCKYLGGPCRFSHRCSNCNSPEHGYFGCGERCKKYLAGNCEFGTNCFLPHEITYPSLMSTEMSLSNMTNDLMIPPNSGEYVDPNFSFTLSDIMNLNDNTDRFSLENVH